MNYIDNKDRLAFILGLLCCIELKIIGTIYFSELIALLCSIFIGYKSILLNKYAKVMLILCVLWLLGQIIADQYNDIELIDALKGEFTIILVIIEMPVVFWLVKGKIHRVLFFFIGYSISNLVDFYFIKEYDSLLARSLWSVYAWEPLALSCGAYLYYKGNRRMAIVTTEAFAVWTLFHVSRHVFLIVSIANVFVYYYNVLNIHRGINYSKAFRRKSIFLFLLLGATIYSTVEAYEYSASNGFLGERAQNKYFEQKYSDNGLASGRMGFFIGLTAVKESPIIGYGSFAKDKQNFALNYYLEHDYDIYANNLSSEDIKLIPSHSYLVGSWVYAGILGALFWSYIVYLIIKAFSEGAFLIRPKYLGMAIYFIFPLLWDIFFSPFSYRLRFLFCIMMIVWYQKENSRIKRLSYSYNKSK